MEPARADGDGTRRRNTAGDARRHGHSGLTRPLAICTLPVVPLPAETLNLGPTMMGWCSGGRLEAIGSKYQSLRQSPFLDASGRNCSPSTLTQLVQRGRMSSLQTELNNIADTFKQTDALIARLVRLHFEPGSEPLELSTASPVSGSSLHNWPRECRLAAPVWLWVRTKAYRAPTPLSPPPGIADRDGHVVARAYVKHSYSSAVSPTSPDPRNRVVESSPRND